LPQYTFLNDETGEYKDVFFKMNDKKEYFGEDGKPWRRIYHVPTTSIDTKIDPFSASEFIRKTNKKGTVGDVMDLSAELSEQRAEKTGNGDPVKGKLFKDYEKKVGKKHLLDKPKVIENSKVKIEL
jgi:hypothetical protein